MEVLAHGFGITVHNVLSSAISVDVSTFIRLAADRASDAKGWQSWNIIQPRQPDPNP